MIIAPLDKTMLKTQGETYQPLDDFSPPPPSKGTFSLFPGKRVSLRGNPIIFTMPGPMEMNSGAYAIDFIGAWLVKLIPQGFDRVERGGRFYSHVCIFPS